MVLAVVIEPSIWLCHCILPLSPIATIHFDNFIHSNTSDRHHVHPLHRRSQDQLLHWIQSVRRCLILLEQARYGYLLNLSRTRACSLTESWCSIVSNSVNLSYNRLDENDSLNCWECHVGVRPVLRRRFVFRRRSCHRCCQISPTAHAADRALL